MIAGFGRSGGGYLVCRAETPVFVLCFMLFMCLALEAEGRGAGDVKGEDENKIIHTYIHMCTLPFLVQCLLL